MARYKKVVEFVWDQLYFSSAVAGTLSKIALNLSQNISQARSRDSYKMSFKRGLIKFAFKDAIFKYDKDRINVEDQFKRLSFVTKVTVI